MKKNTHPKYKPLKIKIGTDVFHTMSTATPEEILMDIDFRKHPAWTKKGLNAVSQSDKNISAFNKRFGGLSLGF
ncbi:MAG: 50S ribosomal protein L31 [Rickettsiaceae bacterium]|nr:50S ribosomal protein L31 [Rickettsiaceae bacterium]